MNKIIELLTSLYEYDVSWLSTPWMLWTVIPAFLYILFMLIKWTVLTMPLWIPVCIVLNSLRK